jgi:hypothetical protein
MQPSIPAGERQIQPCYRSNSSPSSGSHRLVATSLANSSGMTPQGTSGSLFCVPPNYMRGTVLLHPSRLEPVLNGRLSRWMTFCPEWLAGNPSLNTSNPRSFGIYVVVRSLSCNPGFIHSSSPSLQFLNGLWALIPLWLMWNSYHAIAGSLRSTQKVKSA